MHTGLTTLCLYGTMNQIRRMTVYDDFCRKQNAVLFATDIAARGLDFPSVNLKESAKRALMAYMRSIFLMSNKKLFNIEKIDVAKYSA